MELQNVLEKAHAYIDGLTVDSTQNVPKEVVADEHKFFTWDNEYRTPSEKPYLFDWSYYNGVVMEGLYDIYAVNPEAGQRYYDYVKEYLDAMLVKDEDGNVSLNPRLAGYVDHHGADCYKTAAVLMKMTSGHDDYMKLASTLYRDLTDTAHVNSKGNIVPLDFMEEDLGFNYWHSWAGGKAPKYKVWLDGIYMLQPFLASYAAKTGDQAQLDLIKKRFQWVADTMLAPDGMYYHACNSKDDVCAFHWTRAMGWYAMAMVDVMDAAGGEMVDVIKPNLKLFVDGMLKYQDGSGMWANVADWPVTETNRLETSGTAMMVYTILKGVRKGWLDASYRDAAVKAFTAMTELKLTEDGLIDIYMKASANNTNNYENPDYYMPDEGKGSGPYIMAYSEMIQL
ncbi:MAG: glycoside hydrolase family 88 protein [Lachnospiraceae bacterium]|nr:glycoside hydrolase family 88 protein [Lachnospiraceae bacterium]